MSIKLKSRILRPRWLELGKNLRPLKIQIGR
jgi:hypothetical protein